MKKAFAFIALILGIVGFTLGVVPIAGFVLGLVAVALGAVSVTEESTRTVSLTGILMADAALVVSVVNWTLM